MYVKLKWSIAPYIIMYFVAFMLIGMMDLTNAQFDPWRLLEAAYWQEVALLTVGNVLVLLSTSDLYVMKLLGQMEADPNVHVDPKLNPDNAQQSEWHRLQHLIRQGIKAMRENFRLWLHKDNMRVKANAYRLKINKRIVKLNKYSTYKSHLLYDTLKKAEETNTKIVAPTTYSWWRKALWWIFLKPRPNRYVKKRRDLEAKLDDSYIKDRIEYIPIRYDKINESFIRTGYNGEFNSGDRKVESKGAKFFRDHSPRIMLTTAAIAIFRAFLYNPETFTMAVAMSITFKIFVLLSNIIAGRNYAPRYLQEKIIKDENLRLSMLTEYLGDKEFNPPKEAKADANNR